MKAGDAPRGSLCAWSYLGEPQYGVLEGWEDGRLFLRRIDASRKQRDRLVPRPAAEVIVLYTPDELRMALRERTREVVIRQSRDAS